MTLHFIFSLIYLALWCYDAALLIYVVISWLHPAANRWTELLRKVIEPVLTPIRRILVEKLPTRWQIVDWSPVAAWLCIEIVRWMLSRLESIFL